MSSVLFSGMSQDIEHPILSVISWKSERRPHLDTEIRVRIRAPTQPHEHQRCNKYSQCLNGYNAKTREEKGNGRAEATEIQS